MGKVKISDLVDNYKRFRNWLKNHKNLTITKAREIGIYGFIDQYNDWAIDQKYRDNRPFEVRTGIKHSTFRSWLLRNTGKKMRQLTEEEKEDLIIDYKAERGLL